MDQEVVEDSREGGGGTERKGEGDYTERDRRQQSKSFGVCVCVVDGNN